ncbi:hypothetical protein D3C87_1814780 [compost metagenome]
MADIDTEFLGACGNVGEFRLARLLVVGAIADDRLEAHRLDPVEVFDGDLTRDGILVVDLSDIHGAISVLSRRKHYDGAAGASIADETPVNRS